MSTALMAFVGVVSVALLGGLALSLRALQRTKQQLEIKRRQCEATGKAVDEWKAEFTRATNLLEVQVADRTIALATRTRELEESLLVLRRTRESAALSDRLATVGTMAAGVAHEINNPAAFILANASFLQDEIERAKDVWPAGGELDLAPANEMIDAAKSIQEGIERIARIVRDLKTFSRANDNEPMGPVDIVEVIEMALRMAAPQLRDRVQVVRHFDIVPQVHGVSSQLGQVFLNLFVNAAQAMVEGHAHELHITTWNLGDSVGVEVADTGEGMNAELLTRIFDPFFTTRAVGQGAGLGLAVCHGIIEKHGGAIDVESTTGKGTIFRVLLPAVTDAPAKVESPIGQRLRVLVIDDEPRIGESVRRALGKEHDVDCCTNALAALELIGNGQRFDLILCDLMMPEVTGRDFFEQLQRVSPSQAERVLFVSGGTATETATSFAEVINDRLLPKPLDMALLRSKLAARAAMATRPARA